MRKWVAVVWCCLVIRGAFYCSVLPLWEGFDEWAHFAVIERMRVSGEFLVDRRSWVSREINMSLDLAPLPRGMTNMPPHGVTHEEYWNLPGEERARRERQLADLPPSLARIPALDGMPAYQASQPPLYYWLLSGLLTLAGNASLLTRVWIARYSTFLLGSLVVPVAFAVFRQFWKSDALAFAATIFIAVLPGFALNMARVSNESLGIVVFTLLTLAIVNLMAESISWKWTVWAGGLLGLGLLTKAYFLTAIPALAVAFSFVLWSCRTDRCQIALRVGAILVLAFLIGGWWYIRNVVQTGTLSGLDEAIMLRGTSLSEKSNAAFELNWIRAIVTIVLSHIWYSGWSLLALPRWLYYVCFSFIIIALAGLLKSFSSTVSAPYFGLTSLYVFFWLGQAYQIVMLFLSKGSSTAMGGWYLHCLVVVEVVLLYAGFSAIVPYLYRRWIFPVLTTGAAAIDLFGVQRILFTHFSQDVSINKPYLLTPKVLHSVWEAFVVSSVFLVFLSTIHTLSKMHRNQSNTNPSIKN